MSGSFWEEQMERSTIENSNNPQVPNDPIGAIEQTYVNKDIVPRGSDTNSVAKTIFEGLPHQVHIREGYNTNVSDSFDAIAKIVEPIITQACTDERVRFESALPQASAHKSINKKSPSSSDGVQVINQERKYKSAEERKKKKDRKKEAKKKHAASNEIRKIAVENLSKNIEMKKVLIQESLKNVNSNSGISTNRIVFNEDDSDTEEVSSLDMGSDLSTTYKGKLWSESDESDDSDDEVKNCIAVASLEEKEEIPAASDIDTHNLFKVKPQFQGQKGESLFNLQKSYGGDSRFKLDQRFASDDEGEDESFHKDNEDGSFVSTEPNAEFSKEKERSLSILEEVLGKSLKCKANSTIISSLIERYDPTNGEHEEFEIKKKERECTKDMHDEESKLTLDGAVNALVNPSPEVSADKFHVVNSNLKELFSSTCSGPVFSFLDKDRIEKDNAEGSDDKPVAIKKVNWQQAMHDTSTDVVYDGVIDDNDNISSTEAPNVEDKCHSFFLNEDECQIFGTDCNFMRIESVEEVTEQWKSLKKGLTEDYKLKHKDAVRRKKKVKSNQRLYNMNI